MCVRICVGERERNRRLSNAEERNRRGHNGKKKKELLKFESYKNKINVK